MNWILIILATNFYVIVAYRDNVKFSTVVPIDDENKTAGGPIENLFHINGSTSYDDVRCTTTDDVAAARRSLCPAECKCSPLDGEEVLTKLAVNCSGVEFNDSASAPRLGHKLVLLLSRCTSELTELAITNTPFTGIGLQSGVCDLSTIRRLDLSWNCFKFLPKNCFTNMPNLTTFSAAYNHIYYLQVTNSVEKSLSRCSKSMRER